MPSRPIRTEDPAVRRGTTGEGEAYDAEEDDLPLGDYDEITIETPGGEEVTVAVGDVLFDDGERHGAVDRIVCHDDNSHKPSTDSQWRWTVWCDYDARGTGGVPLGELAAQIDEGAILRDTT